MSDVDAAFAAVLNSVARQADEILRSGAVIHTTHSIEAAERGAAVAFAMAVAARLGTPVTAGAGTAPLH